jgi:bifunctional oligoribonuclease and PAP phosphatase NrnA
VGVNLLQEKQKIDKILSSAKKILITSHKRPDPDALGSVIGFKWYVDKYFPDTESRVVFTSSQDTVDESFSFLEGFKYLETVEDVHTLIADFDTFVFLDGSEFSRFTEHPEDFKSAKIKSICIDHHPGDSDSFDYYFRDAARASCSEIVCDILFSDEDLKERLPSEALFVGIHGDTGGFAFVDAARARVFDTAKRIVVNSELVVQSLLLNMSSIDETAFDFLRVLIKNTKNTESAGSFKLPPLTFSFFTKEDVRGMGKEEVKPGRALFVVKYLCKIAGHGWGFVVTPFEGENKFGLSLRSTPGSVNVSEVAKAFGGGGHTFAAAADVVAEDFALTEEEFSSLDGEDVAQLVLEKIEALFDDGTVTITSAE